MFKGSILLVAVLLTACASEPPITEWSDKEVWAATGEPPPTACERLVEILPSCLAGTHPITQMQLEVMCGAAGRECPILLLQLWLQHRDEAREEWHRRYPPE